MNWGKLSNKAIMVSTALFATGVLSASSPASAQTFQNYHCADGTNFIVGFFDSDSRAYVQVDGGSVTLRRRTSFSGARYSGAGVTLKISPLIVTIKHARGATTACERI